MFKPLDGFYARCLVAPKSTDDAVTISATLAATLNQVAEGDWTYLELKDGISYEIVKFEGGSTIIASNKGHAVVPVKRGMSGAAQTFGPHTTFTYQINTPCVEDIVAEYKPKV